MLNSTQNKFSSGLFREIAVTFLLILIYRLGCQVPIPFLDEEAIMSFYNVHGVNVHDTSWISIFALSLMPYVSAYILVEICSLFIPFLKKLRKGDYNGRQKLKRYAFIITFFLAVLQAYFIIYGLEGMVLSNGTKILKIQSIYDYIACIASLIAGVYFLIFIAELISKHGIGNGISILILSGICAKYSHDFTRSMWFFNEVGPTPYLISLIFVFFIFLLIITLLRTNINVSLSHRLLDKPVDFFQLNTCPSGKEAISYSSPFTMLPLTFLHFFGDSDYLENLLSPGAVIYNILFALFIFILSYLFAWLFFNPKRRLDKMRERGWEFPESDHNIIEYLSRRLLIYNLPWTVLLCALVILPQIFLNHFDVPFYIGGTSMYLAVAISLDIIDHFNVLLKSKSGKLVKIAELHDIYDASMIKNHMKSEDILCHFQGYYHRHLLYFFGPYIEMSLMVDESDREPAEKIIQGFYNGLGLLRNAS